MKGSNHHNIYILSKPLPSLDKSTAFLGTLWAITARAHDDESCWPGAYYSNERSQQFSVRYRPNPFFLNKN